MSPYREPAAGSSPPPRPLRPPTPERPRDACSLCWSNRCWARPLDYQDDLIARRALRAVLVGIVGGALLLGLLHWAVS